MGYTYHKHFWDFVHIIALDNELLKDHMADLIHLDGHMLMQKDLEMLPTS